MTDEEELTHIDLFSGIGGFTLAAEWAGFKTVVFCEKEKFCQEVLQKRFGAVITNPEYLRKLQSERGKQKQWERISNFPVLIPEIRDFDGTKYRGTTLLTGGFPCQPFSVAGQRRGKEDDRYLWPEMRRVISEAKPRWILAENVPGIFHMALDTVLADLEGEGYTTGTFIIPACSLNAPHRRNRVWIVANSKTERSSRSIIKEGGQEEIQRRMANILGESDCTSRHIWDAQNTIGTRTGNKGKEVDDQNRRISQDRRKSIRQKDREISTGRFATTNKDVANSTGERLSKSQKSSFEKLLLSAQRGDWEKAWYEVAAGLCRVDDGVSDRVHRLKALGNAIVPQIAYEILKNIAWIENNNS